MKIDFVDRAAAEEAISHLLDYLTDIAGNGEGLEPEMVDDFATGVGELRTITDWLIRFDEEEDEMYRHDLYEWVVEKYFKTFGIDAAQPNEGLSRDDGGWMVLANIDGELARYNLSQRDFENVTSSV